MTEDERQERLNQHELDTIKYGTRSCGGLVAGVFALVILVSGFVWMVA